MYNQTFFMSLKPDHENLFQFKDKTHIVETKNGDFSPRLVYSLL